MNHCEEVLVTIPITLRKEKKKKNPQNWSLLIIFDKSTLPYHFFCLQTDGVFFPENETNGPITT